MEPKVIKYGGYKYFCYDTFRESLQNIFSHNLKNNCDDHYNNFAISCKSVLDKTAPWKKNKALSKSKALSKAIMVRTKLRNTFLKNRSEENKKSYNMQRKLKITVVT